MNKYIFLDIDGVIATQETIEEGMWGLTERCQKLLEEIIKETNAKLVITSSWRQNTIEDTVNYLNSQGFRFCDQIVSITIRAHHYINKESRIHLSIPRGVEIKQWIDTHIHSNNGKDWKRKIIYQDYNYVILDDDNDMLLEQKDHLVITDSLFGLNEKTTLQAINILNYGKGI